jgi:hypothetical protein
VKRKMPLKMNKEILSFIKCWLLPLFLGLVIGLAVISFVEIYRLLNLASFVHWICRLILSRDSWIRLRFHPGYDIFKSISSILS